MFACGARWDRWARSLLARSPRAALIDRVQRRGRFDRGRPGLGASAPRVRRAGQTLPARARRGASTGAGAFEEGTLPKAGSAAVCRPAPAPPRSIAPAFRAARRSGRRGELHRASASAKTERPPQALATFYGASSRSPSSSSRPARKPGDEAPTAAKSDQRIFRGFSAPSPGYRQNHISSPSPDATASTNSQNNIGVRPTAASIKITPFAAWRNRRGGARSASCGDGQFVALRRRGQRPAPDPAAMA